MVKFGRMAKLMNKTVRHQDNVKRTKNKWDEAHNKTNFKMRFAMSHPVVKQYIKNNYLGGKEGPFEILKQYLNTPVERALELACGRGDFAIEMVTTGYAKHIDALDVSDVAVEDARRKAAIEGLENVNFEIADVNSVELPPDTYDLVYFRQSLHHIEALEHVFEQITHTLREGGIFFINDYVGPSRMQWTDKQLEIMNEILAILPERYRVLLGGDLGYPGTHKVTVHRTPVETYLKVDPSEGVRSAEIISLAKGYFDVLDERSLGGTIHYELLRGIVHNFDVNDEKDTVLLEMILLLERMLLENNVVDADFKCFVAKKRKA